VPPRRRQLGEQPAVTRIGVFDGTWSVTYGWVDPAATFTVR
jgi:hypothetical protein